MRSRPVAVLLVVLCLLFGSPGVAWAHIVVEPGEAVRGGYSILAFRTPNENLSARTVRVSLQFPADTPVPFVTVRQVPGWTAQVATVKLTKPVTVGEAEFDEAVGAVVWTATDSKGIGPGEYQTFELQAGPLPDAERLVITADQAYSDGKVVRWSQPPSDGAEPEYPAPVLTLVEGDPSGPHGHSVSLATGKADGRSGSVGLAVGVGALVIAVAALLLTLLERLRRS